MGAVKRCSKCGGVKPLDEFHRDRGSRDGRQYYCKSCSRAMRAAWKARNPERARESARRSNTKRREKIHKWEREHTTPCVDCGQLTSGGYRKQPTQRCAVCENRRRHAEAHARTAHWLVLRKQGFSNIEIAKREGVGPYVVATILQRSYVARFPDLEHVEASYVHGPR